MRSYEMEANKMLLSMPYRNVFLSQLFLLLLRFRSAFPT